jgi:hypothetical protein
VRAGLVPEGQINKRSGLTYFYNYRVIIQPTSKGCGDYDKSRFCGFVELLDGWSLTKNKDNISANEEELFEAVLRSVEPLLKKASATAHMIESRALSEKAQAVLDAMTGHEPPDAKAKRGPRTGNSDHAEPTGKGGKHKKAKVEQPGTTFHGRGKHRRSLLDARVKMSFEERGSDEPPINVDLKGRTVECNTSHPWIAASRQIPEEMAKHALWAWCVAFSLSDDDRQMSIYAHHVFKALGEAISDSSLNGAPVLKLAKSA